MNGHGGDGGVVAWRSAWRLGGANRGVMAGVWWNVVLLAGSVAALPLDRRRILGLNPWIKPIKFEISVIVYLLTVALLLQVLGEGDGEIWSARKTRVRARLGLALGWGFAVCMIVENTLIAMQSARGMRSHMNVTTLFDGLTYAAMGLFIALNTVLLTVLLGLFFVGKTRLPATEVWGIRLGLAMMLAGSYEGVRMVVNRGHTVGAPDGGAGLPFVNWSTAHGDLRVAHFFALHALQLLWLTGFLLARTPLRPRLATGLLWVFAVLYGSGVWVLFVRAMAGSSVMALR